MRSSSTTITLPYLLITSVIPAIKLFAKPQFFSRSTMVTDLNPVTVCIYLRLSSTPFIAFSFFAPSEKIKRSDFLLQRSEAKTQPLSEYGQHDCM